MDCEFCIEFSAGSPRLLAFGDYFLLPTVGCFIPGYCLLVPRTHTLSFAELFACGSGRVDALLRARLLVTAQFGPVIVAEHGSSACNLGAGCCAHAHVHMIPCQEPKRVAIAHEAVGGSPTRLDSVSALSTYAGQSYLYLSTEPGTTLVWTSGAFPRQFVRRVCAELIGQGNNYDWRDHPFTDNMNWTIAALRSAEVA